MVLPEKVEGGATWGKGPAAILPVPVGKADVAQIYSLEDVEVLGPGGYVIYGEPGSGKTVLWSTFTPPFRVIDGDYGLKSLHWAFKSGKSALHCAGRHCIEAYRPIEKDTYPVQPEALDRMCDMIAHWFSPAEVNNWQTLVIDSATEANMWAIYKGLHLNGQLPKPEKSLSVSDSINERAKSLVLTGQQDYKSAEGLFMGAITDIRVDCAKYGKDLVLVCHQWNDTEEKDGVVRIIGSRPWLIGQLRTRIVKDFDDVWHTQMYNGKDCRIQMHESPTIIAKTRWGSIPEIEKDMDYRKMMERVRAFHGIK